MASFNYGELAKTAKTGFDPLPVGKYTCEVTEAEFVIAKTGSPMYKVVFTVEDGPHKGRKIWNNLVLKVDNPNAVGAFFGKMRNLGLDAEFFASLPEVDPESIVCQRLIGRRAEVTVKHREYNGQTQNEVDKISPVAGQGSVAVSDGNLACEAIAEGEARAEREFAAASGPADLPPGL